MTLSCRCEHDTLDSGSYTVGISESLVSQHSYTIYHHDITTKYKIKQPGGSMSQVIGLPNNSYKPITNTAWVRARLCKLQKRCIQLAALSDEAYQLLAHGRWFSPDTPASSTTKTGRHDLAEILLKVALKHQKLNKIKSK